MMMKTALLFLGAFTLAIAACGSTPAGAPAVAPRAPLPGYLAPGAFDVLQVLPPAPTEGDVRYEADRKIFLATRSLEGSARWHMADDDAKLAPADVLRHFSCALDAELEPAQIPRTMRLVQRSVRDAGAAMNVAKEHYKRLRPYRIDSGPLCRAVDDLGESYDYPSGHTMAGWTWGMVLAQLVPERASPLIARGRAIGESRVICGVHNASAIEGARIAATALVVTLAGNAEWQKDLAAARGELAAARRSAPKPDPQACAAEVEMIAASFD